MPCTPIPTAPAVDKDLRIARFLDLPKFIHLLTSAALHFCRSDLLDDPRELLTPNEVFNRPYQTKLANMIEASVRLQVFISSWHIAEHKTATMWKAYASNVAVMSTVGRLVSVLDHSGEDMHYGRVCYHGELFKGGSYDTNILSLSKRPNFEADKEFRAILWRVNGPPKDPEPPLERGIFVPIDIAGLITEVVVSPFAESWLTPTLIALLERLNLGHISVRRSTLFDPPAWFKT